MYSFRTNARQFPTRTRRLLAGGVTASPHSRSYLQPCPQRHGRLRSNRPTALNLKLLCIALQAEGIEHLSSLTLLELGSNRLKSLEPIAGLTRLRELWLGRNRLASLEGLSGCAAALVAGGFTACSAKSCAMLTLSEL